MSDLILGEIKGKTQPLLFTLPIRVDPYDTWCMIDNICKDGETVELTVPLHASGIKVTEFIWPASVESLRCSLGGEALPESLDDECRDGNTVTSYHTFLGKFFHIEKQGESRKLIEIKQCSKSLICISVSLFGKSFTLGWRN